MSEAYIVGAEMTPFGRWPDRSTAELGREAIQALLKGLAFPAEEIDAIFVGRSFGGWIDGQVSIPGQVALRGTGIEDRPVLNFDNACAAAPAALSCAAQAVRSGQYKSVLVVGMDKLYASSRRKSMTALLGALDVRENGWMVASDDEKVGSLFMETYYAKIARQYLERTGASPTDLAKVAIKNRRHAGLNPLAQYREPITEREVLDSPMIAAPLTKLMCSPLTDGAGAMLVCGGDIAKAFPSPIRVAASVFRSGFPELGSRAPVMERAAREAYSLAQISPEDLDLVEVHDASAVAELLAVEQLGLATPSEALGMLREGAFALGGKVPVNPSGGLLSRGHPGAGTGASQLVEVVWQLQKKCGPRQVAGAKRGLTQTTGGLIGDEPACMAITILSDD